MLKSLRYISALILLSLSFGVFAQINQVTVANLAQVIAAHSTDYVVIDVRTQEEFDAGHINGAVLIPVQIIDTQVEEIKKLYAEKDIYLICRSGRRSMVAAGILEPHGLKIFNVQGGMNAWNAQ